MTTERAYGGNASEAFFVTFHNLRKAACIFVGGEIHIYDPDIRLYYLQSRYYDCKLHRFISPDNPAYLGANGGADGYNLYAYCNNNPVNYTDEIGHASDGVATQIAVSFACYIVMAAISIWDKDVRAEKSSINWNPINSDTSAVVNSSKVSFYNGIPVFRVDRDRSMSYCFILFSRSDNEVDLRHESGHNVQQLLLGTINYGLMIGLPSAFEWSERSYYDRPWEVTADIFGGAAGERHDHVQSDINRGYWYLVVSGFLGAIGYSFIIGEYNVE